MIGWRSASRVAGARNVLLPPRSTSRLSSLVGIGGWTGLSCLLLCLCGVACATDLQLASNGQTTYRIVLPAKAIASERYAAEELQQYLRRITGASFPVVSDTAAPAQDEILLGDNQHASNAQVAVDYARLGPDGFAVYTDRHRLVIAGGRPRGTLNGVHTFLEERLGVRWFTPEVETVPSTGSLVLPALREIRVPALEYREVFWTEIMRDGDFASRHRMNGPNCHLTEKHGGPAVVYFPFVHSLDALVPPELYKEHPEYFPLIDGKRVDGYVQRCLSNPDVLKLSVAKVRLWIREHPDATIISVSQNDTGKWCHCEKCKSVDDAEGTPAASLLWFVNAIATDIEHDFPQIRIDTLAYQYTRKPPKTLRPHPNVIIRLCSIECCFAHSLAGCDSSENRRFREDIVAWEPVAPKLYIWDYTPNFAHYQQPFPNFDALQPNVQFFAQHGVKGLFEQGNYSAGGNGELGPLRSYLLAKLLWDPQTDMQRHIREFLAAYYGQAAGPMGDYLELLESQVRGGVHAHIFESPKARYLNDQFLSAAEKIFTRAEQAAENDEIRFRVQTARLPVWYVQIATNRVSGEERKALLQRFLQTARKAGVSNISESQSLEDWGKKIGE